MIRCFFILTNSTDYPFIAEDDRMIEFTNVLTLDGDKEREMEQKDYFGWYCTIPALPAKGNWFLMQGFGEEMFRQWNCKLQKGHRSILLFLEHLKFKDQYEMLVQDEEGNPYSDEQILHNVIFGAPKYKQSENIERIVIKKGCMEPLCGGIFAAHDTEDKYDDSEGVINFVPNKNYVIVTLTHQV